MRRLSSLIHKVVDQNGECAVPSVRNISQLLCPLALTQPALIGSQCWLPKPYCPTSMSALGDSVAKLPLRRLRTKIPLVGRASAGAAHLNFYRKVRRHIGRPMFVRPPRLLNQQPGSRRQQRWMFVAILPAIHKRQKERADLPHQITRQ